MKSTHDIVRFDREIIQQPALVAQLALTKQVFGVIRRGIASQSDLVPVGLRGVARNQRFALEIPADAIQAVIHPWEITTRESFRVNEVAQFPAYAQYHAARKILSGFKWGVGGSLGFELSSGISAIKPTSDFDLLLYANAPAELPLTVIAANHSFFEQFDTQVITAKGGFALKEYLRTPAKKILLKTDAGPLLTKELWS